MQTLCKYKLNKKTQISQCNRNEHYSYSTEEKCYKSNGSAISSAKVDKKNTFCK